MMPDHLINLEEKKKEEEQGEFKYLRGPHWTEGFMECMENLSRTPEALTVPLVSTFLNLFFFSWGRL